MLPSVELLGPPSINLSTGRLSTFRSNRILALIGYLAVHEGHRSREEVAEALWPDKLTDVGRHNLRQVLVYVRQLLGPDSIDSDSSYIALNSSVQVDARTVLQAQNPFHSEEEHLGRARAAVQAFKGLFLAEFSDNWLARPRAQISNAYVTALLLLADDSTEVDPAAALELLNKACTEAPLNDSIRARKIRTLYRLGRHTEARQEFVEYREFLLSELGIAPSPLVEEALRGEGERESSPPKASPLVEELGMIITELGTGQRPQQGVELACALAPFWLSKGQAASGRKLLETSIGRAVGRMDVRSHELSQLALAELFVGQGDLNAANLIIDKLQRESANPFIITKALILSTRIASATLKVDRAEASLLKAQDLAVSQGLVQEQLEIYRLATRIALLRNKPQKAVTLAREAVAAMELLNNSLFLAEALLSLAFALQTNGFLEEAQVTLAQVFEAVGETSAPMATSIRVYATRLLEDIGGVDLSVEEQLSRVEEGYRRAVLESKSYGNAFTIAVNLTYLGDFLCAHGNPRLAIQLHKEALELRKPQQEKLGIATSMRGLGKAYLALGELAQAREALGESARLFQAEEAGPGYASSLLDLARVEARAGNNGLALRLASRSLELLRGMSPAELKTIGPKSEGLLLEAENLSQSIAS